MKEMLSLRSYKGKQLVSFLRQGDYAHAGETDAIELAMSQFKRNNSRKILDVGCGLGGTADYLQKNLWGQVCGFDIDEAAINYAKATYPDMAFYLCDVVHANKVIPNQYDLLTLFNSFYAFREQHLSLLTLHKMTASHGSLLIFDYSNKTAKGRTCLCRKGGDRVTPFMPIDVNHIKPQLQQAGWQLQELLDITEQYLSWYKDLLDRIDSNVNVITRCFGESALASAQKTYREIYNALLNRELGGTIIYAQKIP